LKLRDLIENFTSLNFEVIQSELDTLKTKISKNEYQLITNLFDSLCKFFKGQYIIASQEITELYEQIELDNSFKFINKDRLMLISLSVELFTVSILGLNTKDDSVFNKFVKYIDNNKPEYLMNEGEVVKNFICGVHYAGKGEIQESIRNFENFIANFYPNTFGYHYAEYCLIMLEYKSGKIADTDDKIHKSLLELIKITNYPLLQGLTINLLGLIFHQKGYYKEALEKHFEVLKIGKEYNHIYLKSIAYGNIAEDYITLGNFIDAEKYAKFGRDLDIKLNHEVGVAIDDEILGDLNKRKGRYKEALELYQSTSEVYFRANTFYYLNLIPKIASLLNYFNSSSAIELLLSGLKMAKEYNIIRILSKYYYHLISIYSWLDQKEDALELLIEFEELWIKYPNIKSFESEYYLTAGIFHNSSKRISDRVKAIDYFQKVIQSEYVDAMLKITARFYYLDFLIAEIQLIDNIDSLLENEAYFEIQNLVQTLESETTEQSLYVETVRLLLFKVRIFLIENNIKVAHETIQRAKEIVTANELIFLQGDIDKTQAFILEYVNDIQKIIRNDSENFETFKKKELQDYMKDVIKILDL
jgi:tetratricopeptide (TPR) repeat protein